jgi:hypothetical protein
VFSSPPLQLAYNSEAIQSAIAQANGIPLLVSALSSTTNAKEMMASAHLFSLAASALSRLAKVRTLPAALLRELLLPSLIHAHLP